MLKGYRTFIISALAILVGILGKHVDPDILAKYADVIIAGLGIIYASLRVITDTPVFTALAEDVGLSPSAVEEVKASIFSLDPADKETISGAASDINTAVGSLLGHPLFQPDTLSALSALACSLTTTSGTATTSDPAPRTLPPVEQQPSRDVSLDAQAAQQQQQ